MIADSRVGFIISHISDILNFSLSHFYDAARKLWNVKQYQQSAIVWIKTDCESCKQTVTHNQSNGMQIQHWSIILEHSLVVSEVKKKCVSSGQRSKKNPKTNSYLDGRISTL